MTGLELVVGSLAYAIVVLAFGYGLYRFTYWASGFRAFERTDDDTLTIDQKIDSISKQLDEVVEKLRQPRD
jgi:hypothetical protein